MKKLFVTLPLLASLLAPTLTQAAVIATTENKNGGVIALTNNKCPKNKAGRIVFAMSSGGTSVYGCYVLDDDFIHVSWDDGDTSIYHVGTFTLKEREAKPSM